MSIQIKSILLYNKAGKCRRLDFKIGQVNIVAGTEQTGKSAIIPIIDYCLGNSELDIHSGEVTRTVAFYAVVYQINDKQVLVAKPTPSQEKNRESRVYYEESIEISIPENSSVFTERLNADDDIVLKNFSRMLGISTSEISIRDAIPFLFQEKSLIDNKHELFHSQMKNEKIKENLLFFLNVNQEVDLEKRRKLEQLKKELNQLERERKQIKRSNSEKISRGQNLIYKARKAGLTHSESETYTLDEILLVLKGVNMWQIRPDDKLFSLRDSINQPRLKQEIEELRDRITHIDTRIIELRVLNDASRKYSDEADEQANRLKSIDLFGKKHSLFHNAKICPLCNSELKNATPSISNIYTTLNRLEKDLQFIKKEDTPKLDAEIKRLEDERFSLNKRIKEKEDFFKKYLAEKKILFKIDRLVEEKIEIRGAIKNYLEEFKTPDRTAYMRNKEEELNKEIKLIESQLDEKSIKKLEEATFQWISEPMKQWAEKLQLEGKGSSYYFDFDNLTVVENRKGYRIEMPHIRGGSQWVGCHLIALLALHKGFIERRSRLPNFLIFDQPNKGITSELQQISDALSMQRTFELLFEVCEELAPNLQIIVMDHSHLEENKKFKNAMIESYWTGKDNLALIPEDWK